MLNEKQIYNRLNRFYQNDLIEENSDELFDEWYANPNDELNIWWFERPREKKQYKLLLDLNDKSITLYTRESSYGNKGVFEEETWTFITKVKDKEY